MPGAMAQSEAIFLQASRSCVIVGVLKRCNSLIPNIFGGLSLVIPSIRTTQPGPSPHPNPNPNSNNYNPSSNPLSLSLNPNPIPNPVPNPNLGWVISAM